MGGKVSAQVLAAVQHRPRARKRDVQDLRALGYDFVRGVHNIEGINRWVRVVNAGEAQKAEKETAVASSSAAGR